MCLCRRRCRSSRSRIPRRTEVYADVAISRHPHRMHHVTAMLCAASPPCARQIRNYTLLVEALFACRQCCSTEIIRSGLTLCRTCNWQGRNREAKVDAGERECTRTHSLGLLRRDRLDRSNRISAPERIGRSSEIEARRRRVVSEKEMRKRGREIEKADKEKILQLTLLPSTHADGRFAFSSNGAICVPFFATPLRSIACAGPR